MTFLGDNSTAVLIIGVFLIGAITGITIALALMRRGRDSEVSLASEILRHELEQKHQEQLTALQLRETHLRHEYQTIEKANAKVLEQIDTFELELKSHSKRAEQAEKQLAVGEEKLQQAQHYKQELDEKTGELSRIQNENTELTTRLAQEKKHFEEQFKLLNEAKSELSKEFENLANKIFTAKQQQFTQQSKTTLEGTIDPLRNQLSDFRKKVEDVYEKENADRNKLVGQLGELQKQTQRISEDAINLAKALKGDNKAQGNWGEVILERLLEESGLQKGREYETQVALKNESGKRRNPDVIVRLPENKDIVIDAKVSLVDYERFCSSDDDEEREKSLKQHIASIRGHISNLSIKDYEKLEGIRSLDFVFIFVPVEAAFMLALQHEPALFREAYDKHIILVSPTTLLATLRTVESIWRYEKQNINAEKIAKQAGALYDQFVLTLDALDEVGRLLGKTQDAYEITTKRLKTGRGNLVKRVEDIKRLGAKTKKSISLDTLKEAEATEDDLSVDAEEEELILLGAESLSAEKD